MTKQEKIAFIQGASQYIYDAVLQVCNTHDLRDDDMAAGLAREMPCPGAALQRDIATNYERMIINMAKKKHDLYATVIKFCGNAYRSSWFSDLDKAVEYFNRMPGIIALEKIGEGIIAEKLPQYTAEYLRKGI